MRLFRLIVTVAVSVSRPVPSSRTCTVSVKLGVDSKLSWPTSATVISPVPESMAKAVWPVPPVML